MSDKPNPFDRAAKLSVMGEGYAVDWNESGEREVVKKPSDEPVVVQVVQTPGTTNDKDWDPQF